MLWQCRLQYCAVMFWLSLPTQLAITLCGLMCVVVPVGCHSNGCSLGSQLVAAIGTHPQFHTASGKTAYYICIANKPGAAATLYHLALGQAWLTASWKHPMQQAVHVFFNTVYNDCVHATKLGRCAAEG